MSTEAPSGEQPPVDDRVAEAVAFARREMPSLRDAVSDRMAMHLTGLLSGALLDALDRNPDWPMFLELLLAIEMKRAHTASELSELRRHIDEIEASANLDAMAVQNWALTAETINTLMHGEPELHDDAPLHERLRMYVERLRSERDLAEQSIAPDSRRLTDDLQPLAGTFSTDEHATEDDVRRGTRPNEDTPVVSRPPDDGINTQTRLDVEVPGGTTGVE